MMFNQIAVINYMLKFYTWLVKYFYSIRYLDEATWTMHLLQSLQGQAGSFHELINFLNSL